MDKFERVSRLNGRKYNVFDDDVVRIVNIVQATAYIKNDVMPIDIYASRDKDNEKNILVFLFSKSESKEVYDLWCKHELN